MMSELFEVRRPWGHKSIYGHKCIWIHKSIWGHKCIWSHTSIWSIFSLRNQTKETHCWAVVNLSASHTIILWLLYNFINLSAIKLLTDSTWMR